MFTQGKTAEQIVNVVIVAGQSNAVGWPQGNPAGGQDISGLIPLPDKYEGYQKKIYYSADFATPLVHQRIVNPLFRWGIEQELIFSIRRWDNRPLIILKNARGGIPISEWDPTDGTRIYFMWEELMDLIDLAKAWGAANGYTVRFLSVHWVQGENDSTDALGPLYLDKLTDFINGVRAVEGLENTPWVLQTVSSETLFYNSDFYGYHAVDFVNPAFYSVAGSMDHVYVMNPDTDLPGGASPNYPEFQHFDGATSILMGQAHYEILRDNNELP